MNSDTLDLLGEIDNLNSFIGLARSFIHPIKSCYFSNEINKLLEAIQNDLFIIQADINSNGLGPIKIDFDRVIFLQTQTCSCESELPKLDKFILPAGTQEACFLHCARTAARNVERKIPGWRTDNPPVNAQYFDRLACLLFALARHMNYYGLYNEKNPTYRSYP